MPTIDNPGVSAQAASARHSWGQAHTATMARASAAAAAAAAEPGHWQASKRPMESRVKSGGRASARASSAVGDGDHPTSFGQSVSRSPQPETAARAGHRAVPPPPELPGSPHSTHWYARVTTPAPHTPPAPLGHSRHPHAPHYSYATHSSTRCSSPSAPASARAHSSQPLASLSASAP